MEQRGVRRRHPPVRSPSRRLFGAGQQAAEHHRIRAARHRLRDVPPDGDPAVGDDRHVPARAPLELRARGGDVHDRGGLRDADAEDLTAGARRAGPHPHKERGDARLEQLERRLVGDTVPGHDGHLGLRGELAKRQRLAAVAAVLLGDHGGLDQQHRRPAGVGQPAVRVFVR